MPFFFRWQTLGMVHSCIFRETPAGTVEEGPRWVIPTTFCHICRVCVCVSVYIYVYIYNSWRHHMWIDKNWRTIEHLYQDELGMHAHTHTQYTYYIYMYIYIHIRVCSWWHSFEWGWHCCETWIPSVKMGPNTGIRVLPASFHQANCTLISRFSEDALEGLDVFSAAMEVELSPLHL